MDKMRVKDWQIRWKANTSWEIIQNSQEIIHYFAGKLEEEQSRKQKMLLFIRTHNLEEIQFYYLFLSCIQVWKLYWYFSPLYRPAQKIFTYLAPISFPHLTRLVINQSNIYSIQSLAFLYCPALKQLDIEENYITSLKPLAKTNFPQLIVLKYYYNNFNHGQNEWISRTQWKSFHPLGLYHFWKETFYTHYFKFQPQSLKKIYVERTKGEELKSDRIINKLQDKFIVEQFFVHFSKC